MYLGFPPICSPLNCHFTVVGEFKCPNDPRSYYAWGFRVGSPMATIGIGCNAAWALVKVKCLDDLSLRNRV